MDYTQLLQALEQASAFDLYRLRVAIDKALDDPQRTQAVRKHLRLGMTLTYFDEQKNRPVPAIVREVRRTKVLIFDQEEQRQWVMPYYMLNIDGVDTAISDATSGKDRQAVLTANQLHVGDRVGFNHDGRDIVGTIKRLNRKTVTLVTADHHQWRVSYRSLYRVHDGDLAVAGMIIDGTASDG
jgi:hypothetical protein